MKSHFLGLLVQKDVDAKALAQSAADAVNYLTFHPASSETDLGPTILRDPEMLAAFLPLAFAWIRHLDEAYRYNRYDMRNARSCYTGSQLLQLPPFRTFEVHDDNPSFTKEFVSYMAREHRTLQQQFSGVCFYVAYMAIHDATKDKAELALYMRGVSTDPQYGFWNMPLI